MARHVPACCNPGLEFPFDPLEHRDPVPRRFRDRAGRVAEAPTSLPVAHEIHDRSPHRGSVGRGHHASARRDHLRDLGAGRRRGHNRTAACEHPAQLRRHHEVGSLGLLGQEMNVRHRQQRRELLLRLQRQQLECLLVETVGLHRALDHVAPGPGAGDDEAHRWVAVTPGRRGGM
jgi:hypothetical protein